MIYLTGDTHKDMDIFKLFSNKFQALNLTKNDYLIILGDFGFPFLPTDATHEPLEDPTEIKQREIYQQYIKKLSDLPCTILFIDGNHDNHAFWYQQPTIHYLGGKVHPHPDAKNIYHLMRGEYFTIEGHTFFTMGGANSIDKAYRKENYTWWKDEIPKQSERIHGFRSLELHGNQVDFILTHCMPQSFIEPILHQTHHINGATHYLDLIYKNNKYKYWFCGHYHVNINDPNFRIQMLYNTIVSINDYLD